MPLKIKGFSLTELMIVLAIMAILAAIATPAYLDSVAQAYVSEAFASMGPCQRAVETFSSLNGRLPTTAELASDASCNTTGNYTKNINTITYTGDGGTGYAAAVITTAFTSNNSLYKAASTSFAIAVDATAYNAVVGSGTSGEIKWVCKTPSTGTQTPIRYTQSVYGKTCY